MTAWLVSLAVVLFVWMFGIGFLIEERVYIWYIDRSHESVGRTIVLVVALQVAAGLGCILMWGVGTALAEGTGIHALRGVIVVAAFLVYCPWQACLLPPMYGNLSASVDQVYQLGATRGVARALIWTSAPLSIIGTFSTFAIFDVAFVSG